MTLVKFNPQKPRNDCLQPLFTDVFDSILNDTFFSDRMNSRVPAANVSESEDHYHVELAAPGLKKEDFKLSLERNVLSMLWNNAAKTTAPQKNYNEREYSNSSWLRSFTLPDSTKADQIAYTDGVLKIDIAKREDVMAICRQIQIKYPDSRRGFPHLSKDHEK